MTIQLKDPIFIAGVHQAAGTSLTLGADVEAELVNRGVAVFTSRMLTPGENLVPAMTATDASGNTALVDSSGKPVRLRGANKSSLKPTLLVFGNSLAAQSNYAYLGAATTTVPTATPAGSASLTLAAIGSIVSGTKLAVQLYDGTTLLTTVTGAPVGNVVALPDPLPKMVRAGASVAVYTTVTPSNMRRGGGPVYQGLTQVGMPVTLIQGYGYGGGTMPEMLADLPHVLAARKPNYALLILPENSYGSGAAQLIAWLKTAIQICLDYGVTPLVNTMFPSTSYATVETYDDYNAYVRGQMLVDYAFAECIDVGDQWLDPAYPTKRWPLATWTDGIIHPAAIKFASIGAYYAAEFATKLPPAPGTMADTVITANPTLTGTGGTATNLEVGSVVPDAYTFTATGGGGVIAVTTTPLVGGAGVNVNMTVPGTSDITNTVLSVRLRMTAPANYGARGAGIAGYVKAKINAVTGLSMMYPYFLHNTSGVQNAAGQESLVADWANVIGDTLWMETGAIDALPGNTYVDLVLFVRPVSGLSNGVNIDFDLLEMGVFPAEASTNFVI